MKKLDSFVSRRLELVKRYDLAFSGSEHIKPAQTAHRDNSAHHLYPVCINFAAAGTSRAVLMQELRRRGVITQVHYIPVTMQPYYKHLGFLYAEYPNANAYYDQALSLPLYVDLTNEQQDSVITHLRELLG